MSEFSRTTKYRNLREHLQNDNTVQSGSKELNRFESRLNKIDSTNFAAPNSFSDADYNASHARDVNKSVEAPELRRTQHERVRPGLGFSDDLFGNENHTIFDNDYLDRYIQEVKQYNLEQGNAFSENTQLNVLKHLESNQQSERPYADFGNSPLNIPFRQETAAPAKQDTMKMPVIEEESFPQINEPVRPLKQRSQNNTSSFPAYNEDLFETPEEETDSLQRYTKEELMAEVRNLVNGINSSSEDAIQRGYTGKTSKVNVYDRNYDEDRTARQQLLHETTQMRAQLDDYEENLNDVTDKMRYTNQVLNLVLVVLIVALTIVLGIVIYWIVISKGA